MRCLTPEQMSTLSPAAPRTFPALVPTQIVSSDEYLPPPQTAQQREVEARLRAAGSALAKKHGMTRRRFFQTAAGMAVSYNVRRRLEIPEGMQRRHGFPPLGPADGTVKSGILAGNGLRLFGAVRHAASANRDRLAALKAEYEGRGPARSNLRDGYIPDPS